MSSDDEGYVHRPGEVGDDAPDPAGGDAADDVGEADTAAERAEAAAGEASGAATTDAAGFGSRGWVLVAVLAACTLVVPGVIYVRPGILSTVGIPYIASLLVLPLLPAVALGLTAVWAMTAATKGGK